jgi:acid phosphatase
MNVRFTVALFLTSIWWPSQQATPQRTYHNLNSLAWLQTSAEYKSISLQTFQAAEMQMARALADSNWTAANEQSGHYQDLPPAIILDLDETVLDNSAYNARFIRDGTSHSDAAWDRWMSEQAAHAVPGATEFLKSAHASGVVPFFVTNRVCDAANAADNTAVMLMKLQFPFAPERLLCKARLSDSSDKSPRRARVASTHRVLLILGDDLNDFVTVAGSTGVQAQLSQRDRAVQNHRPYWGTRWFMLPNPVYGSWERVIGEAIQPKLDVLRY